MYKIGELSDPKMAELIVQDLQRADISSEVLDKDGLLSVVVHNEQDVDRAFDIFRVRLGFAPRHEIPEEFKKMQQIPWGSLTPVLLGISLLVSLAMLVYGREVASLWFMSSTKDALFYEVINGQWWRLLSPIFLHFGLLHIMFNMLVLKDFAPLMEEQHGLKNSLIWITVIALCSNLAQYVVQGPQFGGMSGVLFGLLGVIWTYKVFYPSSEFSLPKSSVVMLLVWFFLCLFGLIPNIANMAHAVGLTVGMLIGIGKGYLDQVRLDRAAIKYPQLLLYSLFAVALSALTFAIEFWKLGGEIFIDQF